MAHIMPYDMRYNYWDGPQNGQKGCDRDSSRDNYSTKKWFYRFRISFWQNSAFTSLLIRPKNVLRSICKISQFSNYNDIDLCSTMTSGKSKIGKTDRWRHNLTELWKEGPDSSIALCNSPKAYEYVQDQNKFQMQLLQGAKNLQRNWKF